MAGESKPYDVIFLNLGTLFKMKIMNELRMCICPKETKNDSNILMFI